MRPPVAKGCLPRVHHLAAGRIVLGIVAQARLDARDDGPAAVWGQSKVFHERIIVLFPPSHILVAQEASCIVGILGRRREVESSACELRGQASQHFLNPRV